MATTIRDDQIQALREFADELERIEGATRIGMPPQMVIHQLQRALLDMAQRLRAILKDIQEET